MYLSGLLVSSWAWAWVVLAAGCGFSLAAVAYFNPPRWWRAYIIHNYRFHFCLPVIIVAFLDDFFHLFFTSQCGFYCPPSLRLLLLLAFLCRCASYGFLIFNFYDVLMDIFMTWPPGVPLLWPKLTRLLDGFCSACPPVPCPIRLTSIEEVIFVQRYVT